MTTLNFVGGATPGVSTSFTGYNSVTSSTGVALPTTAQLAANGNRPVYVATANCYWAGKGGTRTLRMIVGGYAGPWVNVGSNSSAQASGSQSIGVVFPNGGTTNVGIDKSGSGDFYFGRSSSTGSTQDSSGYTWGGALSGSLEYWQVPTAPTIGTVTQAALENAVNVTWSAPSSNGGSAITSYNVVWSYSSSFASSTTISTGSTATSYKITGLTYGSTVYVKVAAVNLVATANATTSVFSASANGYLTPPDLPLNGWANFGTLTNNTFTLKRTSIPALIPTTGMLRTATASATGATYGTWVGIEKTYTDLIVGRQYVVSGKAILLTAGVPGNIYRFNVLTIGFGSSVTLTSTTVGATIPSYTFTATSTTHTVRIELAETFTVTATGKQEDVAFYEFALTRTAVDLAYRVQDNMENASLVEHFDLATQSVGAYWWVDKLNTTQFTQNFNYVAPSCIFSDVIADGNMYYTDIQTAYDTSAVVNQLTFDNIGKRPSTLGGEAYETFDVEWVATDSTSTTNWGPRKQDLKTNLYTAVDRYNYVPNPTLTINQNYLFSTASSGTYTLTRQPLASLTTGATGFMAAGTTQPVAGAGAYVASMYRGNSSANTFFGYGGDTSFGSVPLISILPSTKYTASVYLRTGIGQATSALGAVWAYWHDINGTVISSATSTASAISATAWTRYSVTFTAPANAYYVQFYGNVSYSGANNTGFRYYATCAQLEAASTASGFFSGDITDSATYAYEWEGTPGQSRSIRYLNPMSTRSTELLAQLSTPIVRVNTIKFNTAQNPIKSAQLDIGSLVTITFKGTTGTYRIVGINHDITPERWMMELQVAKV